MKKFIVFILFSVAAVAGTKAQVNVNINIGSQPVWGPAGYDYAEYYYLPDIESYYDVPRRQFVYLSNGRWIFSAGLPPAYRGYDLYSGYKVVLNSPRPYRYFSDHRMAYSKYKGYRGQAVIKNKGKVKYYAPRGQSKNVYHVKEMKGGKGHGGGHGKGQGKGKH
ncbi:hypothetical protein C7T94_09460 [Pedobacter yulinensis]|uniref:PBCV-specific basic adaptor domain-containing protein n=1 Tax=Pedobacter yulinensis TaxID=2126353 RepID=A0A2T3HK72_9SPHI|nr:hypothetical protein [Pedobacter yulinensis]PST82855.1 hypothetical protein C7T94_09460 [Pedobacter yulinensis]